MQDPYGGIEGRPTWDPFGIGTTLNDPNNAPGAPSTGNPNSPGATGHPAGGGVPMGGGGSPGMTWNPPAGAAADTWGAAGSTLATKDWGGYAAIINAIIGAYGAVKGNKFHQAPDPMNDALRARMYGFIDDSPSRNTFGQALIDYINQGKGTSMPMMPSKYGYDPYPNGTPKYDLSNLIPMIQSTMTKSQVQQGQGPDGPERPRTDRQLSQPMTAPTTQLSQSDVTAFKSFVGQYGQQAGEAVAVMIEQNPSMGVQAAMQRVMSMQGQVG